jgi:kynureninase
VGTELLVDAYHALNAVPFGIGAERLERAFVLGGGYKYCQLGEGNCFLRVPRDCVMRPAITGWFAEFDRLAESHGGAVTYARGAQRFAGATYDPTSHYRAARVFDFFETMQLTPALLREVSRHQVALLARRFDALAADPAVITRDRHVPLEGVGGFLALRSPHAASLGRALGARGVAVDARGDYVRLGPAPYLSDRQLEDAMTALAEVLSGA